MLQPLPQAFFGRSALVVARDLIGCTFLFHGAGGRIVETEAYRQDDPCCHGYNGKTARNAVLFGPPGHMYVYFTYGMHFCANVACEPEGTGAGVLLRAIVPEHGVREMIERRGVEGPRLLCSGPARLAQALGIGREQSGLPVWEPPLAILPWAGGGGSSRALPRIVATPRIGVRRGDQKPWRFVDADSRFLSRPLPRVARPATTA
ncbi:MAG: DNA-3-methyladenine glycosylase [Actinobacteria bacterium]|nr:DNA-3-methyladenine glycosylase [Actinomycetota bacterium]